MSKHKLGKQIFLDMDGVLVDMQTPLFAKHGITSRTDMTLMNGGGYPMSQQEMWEGIDSQWWADLPWTKDGPAILKHCEDAVGKENVYLCTSPSMKPNSAKGKVVWIQKHMPEYAQRYILTRCKAACASSRTMLIDDSEHNTEPFRDAGGASLLLPREWNRLWPLADRDGMADYVYVTLLTYKSLEE